MNDSTFPRNTLKAFAIVIITNFHCQNLYPSSIKFISTGAALGLCLFFFMAGFSSINSITKSSSFISWFSLKFARLYIPVFTFSILTFLLNLLSPNLFSFINLIIPYNLYLDSSYWFVGTIILYYIILYFLVKLKINLTNVLIIISILFISTYLIVPNPNKLFVFPKQLEHFLYLFSFVAGSLINEKKIIKFNNLNLSLNIFIIIFFYILYSLCNFLAVGDGYRGDVVASSISHIKLLTYPFILLVTFFVIKLLGNNKMLKFDKNKFIVKLSSITLEIYLVQFFVINFCSNYRFPYNLILVAFIILVTSLILNYINNILYNKLKKITNFGK